MAKSAAKKPARAKAKKPAPAKPGLIETLADSIASPKAAPSLLEVIAAAARDPRCGVEKMRVLAAMRKELQEEEASAAWDAAMTACQAEMAPIAQEASNPQTQSKYASYVQLDRALRPIYTAHGFNVTFDTEPGAPADHVRVVVDVSHGGHSRRRRVDMPTDGKDVAGIAVNTKTHATSGAFTYAQRQLLRMAFNIAIGKDTDGNAPEKPLMPEQIAFLRKELEAVKISEHAFCEFMCWENLDTAPASMFARAVATLAQKRAVLEGKS